MPTPIITSKNILFNSNAISLEILKLHETIPPYALTGSLLSANLKLLILSLLIETPEGFVCLTITVPIFFGKDFEIASAENMSL